MGITASTLLSTKVVPRQSESCAVQHPAPKCAVELGFYSIGFKEFKATVRTSMQLMRCCHIRKTRRG